MSKTVLAQTSGFTPVIDDMVENLGYMTALVFGIVWRYCQMDNGKCYASQKTLALKIGIGRRTMQRHLDVLVSEGYLSVQPTKTTSIYVDTGKAGLKINISGYAKEAQSKQSDAPEMRTTLRQSGATPAPEWRTKKELKREDKREVVEPENIVSGRKEKINNSEEKNNDDDDNSGDGRGQFGVLLDKFIKETGIAETMLMNQSNMKTVNQWVAGGITEDEIEEAVKELLDKNFKISRPASINNSLNIVRSRNSKNAKKQSATKGEIYE